MRALRHALELLQGHGAKQRPPAAACLRQVEYPCGTAAAAAQPLRWRPRVGGSPAVGVLVLGVADGLMVRWLRDMAEAVSGALFRGSAAAGAACWMQEVPALRTQERDYSMRP